MGKSDRITMLSVFHEESPMYLGSQQSHEKYARVHGNTYRIETFDFMKHEEKHTLKFYDKIAHILRVILE